jgi:hypothetical protein
MTREAVLDHIRAVIRERPDLVMDTWRMVPPSASRRHWELLSGVTTVV